MTPAAFRVKARSLKDFLLPGETSDIVEGASWVQLSRHADGRGVLTAFDPDELPFAFQRYFVIEAGPGAVRGGHSSSAHELLTCFAGCVSVDLDNGIERATVTLSESSRGLWLKPGVWLRLHGFAEGTVLGVAASQHFAETERWPMPNRQLLE